MKDLEVVDHLIKRLDYLGKLQIAVIALTSSFVLWAGRLDWVTQRNQEDISVLKVEVKDHGLDISAIKGRAGIVSIAPEECSNTKF